MNDIIISNAISDAVKISRTIPKDVPNPTIIWTDLKSEVVFEWLNDRKAIMSFEGDGHFGCALFKNEKWVPATCDTDISHGFPNELTNHLRENNKDI